MTDLKYGRNNPKRTPSLKLANILKAIPVHPLSEDYLANLSDWQMLGNDQYGDCAAVSWANSRRFITTLLGGKGIYPSLTDVLKLYKTQNPGFPNDDNGMDMQTMLEYLNHRGGTDGVKLVAFASVDVSNLEEVKAALYIFGSLLLGIEVQAENQQDFSNGTPWDYHAGAAVEGGHAVLGGGFSSQPSNDVRFITWGAETGMTDAFWKNLVNCPSGEAWVCIWPENLGTKQFIAGIDMNTLAADYYALTGKTLAIPAPAPAPVPPTPAPSPIPAPPTPPAGGYKWLVELFNWIIALLKPKS
jgi:hypothetical protein